MCALFNNSDVGGGASGSHAPLYANCLLFHSCGDAFQEVVEHLSPDLQTFFILQPFFFVFTEKNCKSAKQTEVFVHDEAVVLERSFFSLVFEPTGTFWGGAGPK